MTDLALQAQPPVARSYQHFLEFLREEAVAGPVLSPRRFSEALKIDLKTLAEQAHVHRNTITRAPDSQGVQSYLREALRVIKAATDLHGDVDAALFWYRNEPLAVFAYRTAERLVSDGRTEDLLRYLMALEAGAAG